MPTYRVVIKGVQRGQDSESVLNGLAALVRKNAAVIRPILTSGYFVIKRSVDQPTARKYKAVLENVGCACEIEMEVTPESDGLPAQKSQMTDSPTISRSRFTSDPSQTFCPQCGASVASGRKFCGQCGRNITALQPEAAQHRDNSQPIAKSYGSTTIASDSQGNVSDSRDQQTKKQILSLPDRRAFLAGVILVSVLGIAVYISTGGTNSGSNKEKNPTSSGCSAEVTKNTVKKIFIQGFSSKLDGLKASNLLENEGYREIQVDLQHIRTDYHDANTKQYVCTAEMDIFLPLTSMKGERARSLFLTGGGPSAKVFGAKLGIPDFAVTDKGLKATISYIIQSTDKGDELEIELAPSAVELENVVEMAFIKG